MPVARDLNVAIRVDADRQLGAGHLMRCLTLGTALRAYGAQVVFIGRRDADGTARLASERGFHAVELERDWRGWEADAAQTIAILRSESRVDWLVVDHYGLDARWESGMRLAARQILVIDDLADRKHDCDALLDQNYYADAERRYDGLVPRGCRLFLGPRFVLLRDEFMKAPPRIRDGTVRRLLVSFGATDPTHETGKVLEALGVSALPGLEVDVVIGAGNVRRREVEALCAALPGVSCHVQSARMAELMQASDLAIGAGGATSWERCALGLPTLTVVTAQNQLRTMSDLAAAGAIWYLGRAELLAASDYASALREALASPRRLIELSAQSRAIMAAQAAAGRHPVVSEMLGAPQHA